MKLKICKTFFLIKFTDCNHHRYLTLKQGIRFCVSREAFYLRNYSFLHPSLTVQFIFLSLIGCMLDQIVGIFSPVFIPWWFYTMIFFHYVCSHPVLFPPVFCTLCFLPLGLLTFFLISLYHCCLLNVSPPFRSINYASSLFSSELILTT